MLEIPSIDLTSTDDEVIIIYLLSLHDTVIQSYELIITLFF